MDKSRRLTSVSAARVAEQSEAERAAETQAVSRRWMVL